jgi:hypothetical protein
MLVAETPVCGAETTSVWASRLTTEAPCWDRGLRMRKVKRERRRRVTHAHSQ